MQAAELRLGKRRAWSSTCTRADDIAGTLLFGTNEASASLFASAGLGARAPWTPRGDRAIDLTSLDIASLLFAKFSAWFAAVKSGMFDCSVTVLFTLSVLLYTRVAIPLLASAALFGTFGPISIFGHLAVDRARLDTVAPDLSFLYTPFFQIRRALRAAVRRLLDNRAAIVPVRIALLPRLRNARLVAFSLVFGRPFAHLAVDRAFAVVAIPLSGQLLIASTTVEGRLKQHTVCLLFAVATGSTARSPSGPCR